ncbi:hypothetical protein PUN28_000799 [Cardiocondyla obscurior]|uniref:Uncharacterized protein n=1 Tax=Cardiocondyla obscurior TaxID=286306 RepID=A0AAW2H143_9HYME
MHADVTLFIHMSAGIVSASTLAAIVVYMYVRLLRFASSSMQNTSEHRINANAFAEKPCIEKGQSGIYPSRLINKGHLRVSDRGIIDTSLNKLACLATPEKKLINEN